MSLSALKADQVRKVNSKCARAFNFFVPGTVLARADNVIEWRCGLLQCSAQRTS
jgi:hypothetical protein